MHRYVCVYCCSFYQNPYCPFRIIPQRNRISKPINKNNSIEGFCLKNFGDLYFYGYKEILNKQTYAPKFLVFMLWEILLLSSRIKWKIKLRCKHIYPLQGGRELKRSKSGHYLGRWGVLFSHFHQKIQLDLDFYSKNFFAPFEFSILTNFYQFWKGSWK